MTSPLPISSPEPNWEQDRRQHDRERRIYWARLHASEGCEASARELDELLEEGPLEGDLVPLWLLSELDPPQVLKERP